MALLKDLIVLGSARIIADSYLGNVNVEGTIKRNGVDLVDTNDYRLSNARSVNGGTAYYASYLTPLTVNDSASAVSTNRRVWFCYSDNSTGRPAYDDNFTFRADTHSLTIGGSYYANSDIRYKLVQNNTEISSETIAAIPIFDYKWADENHDNLTHTGSSAQAVMSVLPNLVTYDKDKDFYNLDYATLGTVAGITACKEILRLKSQIEILKQEIEELKYGKNNS